jgi:hypothetical protein
MVGSYEHSNEPFGSKKAGISWLRFKILMAVKMSVVVFRVVMLCALVGGYQYSSKTTLDK